MSDDDRPMGTPPEGTDVPVQGITSEEREAFGAYSRLEKDPRDPTKGEDPTYITRNADR